MPNINCFNIYYNNVKYIYYNNVKYIFSSKFVFLLKEGKKQERIL